MTRREEIAAWLGLVGLVTGVYVFAVFVMPPMVDHYTRRRA